MNTTKPKGKRKKVVKAFGVIQMDFKGELLPVALTFKTRALMMDNIPRKPKTKVVPVTITYEI